LAKRVIASAPQGLYLDLERPSDAAKLTEAEFFLQSQKGKLICLDEIQRRPDLFPLIRSLVDDRNAPGAFLILGSASRDLLLQSSESLAGRISLRPSWKGTFRSGRAPRPRAFADCGACWRI
jgi:predicted AAA+ superfamily ATPase